MFHYLDAFGTAARRLGITSERSSLKISVEKRSRYHDLGRFDLYDAKTKTVIDYKTCSVWKVIFGDYTDWYMQTLMYAYLLRESGFEADHGEIVAIMRDHSKRDAKYKQDYPEYPVKRILFNFKAVDFEFIENWLKEKVEEIKRCEELPDDELPICTPEERFNSGDKFAVMAKGRKRALRVLDSLRTQKNGKNSTVETISKREKARTRSALSIARFVNSATTGKRIMEETSMKIKEITSQYRRDFYAIYECEHCGATHKSYGYDDANFHNNVIPNMVCEKWQKGSRQLQTTCHQISRGVPNMSNLRIWEDVRTVRKQQKENTCRSLKRFHRHQSNVANKN